MPSCCSSSWHTPIFFPIETMRKLERNSSISLRRSVAIRSQNVERLIDLPVNSMIFRLNPTKLLLPRSAPKPKTSDATNSDGEILVRLSSLGIELKHDEITSKMRFIDVSDAALAVFVFAINTLSASEAFFQ